MLIQGHAIIRPSILLLFAIYILPSFTIKNNTAVSTVMYYFSQTLHGICFLEKWSNIYKK